MTASVQNVRMVLAAAAARGVAPSKLLAASGLDPVALIAAEGRVAAEPALRAWQIAAELSGDPQFGLAVANHLPVDYMGSFGLAMHGSATLGDALRRLVRFFPLVNQQASLSVIEDGALARVRFAFDLDIENEVTNQATNQVTIEALRHPTECLLAVVLRVARRTTGVDLRPRAVSLRHTAPADLDPYAGAFGVVPRFGQPWHEIAFDRAALATPQLAPDSALAALAERHLHRRIEELPAAATFTARVRRAVAEELGLGVPAPAPSTARVRRAVAEELELGEPTLARLAARLRMSERTLQRRLGAEGTSVQALLDATRHQLSLRQLAESNQSIAEISFLLGFAEVRAFHRAFKRWTGSTPAAYRQARSAS